MILKALHKAGWLDIGAQERIERELINFRRCLSPGQLIDVPDEYRYFKNIDSAIRCKLLEVVNYDSSPGSLVVNGELEKILFDSSSSSSLNSSSSSSYIKGISYRARNFSIKAANGCYIELGVIENDYPVYSNGNYILKYGGEYFPRWYLEDIATLAIHYTANPGIDPDNSGDLYTPFLFWLGNGGKINLGCGEESSSSSQSSSSSESSVSSQSSLSSLSSSESSESSESSYSSESSSSQSARLPAEYQEVEYLQPASSGVYIDTGLSIVGRIWEIKTSFASATGPYQGAIVKDGTTYYRCHTDGNDTTFGGRLGSTMYTQSGTPLATNTIVFSSVDGVKVNDSAYQSYSGTLPTISLYIFSRHGSGLSNYPTLSQVFYSKMWTTDGELVQSLVPCCRKSDSVAGMYDLVNGVFYANQGTGSFIVGPNIN